MVPLEDGGDAIDANADAAFDSDSDSGSGGGVGSVTVGCAGLAEGDEGVGDPRAEAGAEDVGAAVVAVVPAAATGSVTPPGADADAPTEEDGITPPGNRNAPPPSLTSTLSMALCSAANETGSPRVRYVWCTVKSSSHSRPRPYETGAATTMTFPAPDVGDEAAMPPAGWLESGESFALELGGLVAPVRSYDRRPPPARSAAEMRRPVKAAAAAAAAAAAMCGFDAAALGPPSMGGK